MLRSHADRAHDVGRGPRYIVVAAVFVGIFLLFSANFAYFFVDDEAIPFVYAQNILKGEGLVYNPDDGPVEGYSDFLTVWIDTAILHVVTLGGGGKLSALIGAKLVSLTCAVALIVLGFVALTATREAVSVPVVAGMAFLVLAGPLALWAWSGLETTLFALLVAIFVVTLLGADRPQSRNDRLMLAVLLLMLLCRIDGFVWAGAIGLPFLFSVSSERRRALLQRVVVPAVAVFALYHGWRVWYFGEPLPMPLYAKVLYKLGARETLISHEPSSNYLIAYFRASAWLPAVILLLGCTSAYTRSRELRALAIGVLSVTGYLSLVGDWMFGFRFFVGLLVPFALLAALGFERLMAWHRRAGTVAAVLWIAMVGYTAFGFERTYEDQLDRASWLMQPSADPSRFFAPYYEIYLRARAEIGPGDTLAYNQAGFVPFMLDARNIDDLGICTKFYAKLPTTDIVFTEVGRYSPPLSRAALRASDMYTVARAPRLLLAPGSNIRAANGGRTPADVFGGRYRLRFNTDSVAGYVPAREMETVDASDYLENLAHISHLQHVSLNGNLVPASEYRALLPSLYERTGHLRFSGQHVATFRFSDTDEDVFRLFVGRMRSLGPVSIEFRLQTTDGKLAYRHAVDLPSRTPREIDITLPDGLRAAELSMTTTPGDRDPQEVELLDLRVQGQSRRLKRFVEANLHQR